MSRGGTSSAKISTPPANDRESVDAMKFDKAKDLAAQAKQKATEVAGGLAEKVAPLAEKGVDAAGDAANKATGGKYEEKIKGVTDKVEGAINKSKPDNTGK